MKITLKRLVLYSSFLISLNQAADLRETLASTTVTSDDHHMAVSKWRSTFLPKVVSTGIITPLDLQRLRECNDELKYLTEGRISFDDMLSLIMMPELLPRTHDELRESRLKGAIAKSKYLNEPEKRILSGFLPEATMVDMFNAAEEFTLVGSMDHVKQLMMSVVCAGSDEHINALMELFPRGRVDEIRRLEQAESINVRAAHWLERNSLGRNYDLAIDAYQMILEIGAISSEDERFVRERLENLRKLGNVRR